jgi:hypothetical protein
MWFVSLVVSAKEGDLNSTEVSMADAVVSNFKSQLLVTTTSIKQKKLYQTFPKATYCVHNHIGVFEVFTEGTGTLSGQEHSERQDLAPFS